MTTYDYIVYGNNMAALVSAHELSKKNKIAIINPAPNWGAHFAGIIINETNFDIGMNFFEFSTFHKKDSNLLSYDPLKRNDSARFFDLVQNFICDQIETVLVDKIEVFVNGLFAEDIIMANSLDIFKKLPTSIVSKIKSELEVIIKNGNKSLHASQKKLNEELFLNTSYFDVSMANHGKTFHDLFIEPFCKKIFNMSSKDCPALLHRIAWTPLYYPETLLNGIDGIVDLSPTLFHYPKKGNFSAITESIFQDIKLSSNVTIISQKPESLIKTTSYEFDFEDKKVTTNKLIWCNDLQSLLQVAHIDTSDIIMEKASLLVVFCSTEFYNIKRQFSSLYVSDDGPLYRITNQEYSAKINNHENVRLIFEFNFDVLNEFGLETNDKILEYLNHFLLKNNILNNSLRKNNVSFKALKNAVNLPTLNNLINFEKLLKIAQNKLSGIDLVGPASGFVSTSFNDQIIQGLKIGQKYN
jgi:hypothetical protein